MKDERFRKALAAMCEEMQLEEDEQPIILDSMAYDRSIVGVTDDNRLIYSYQKMVEELMEDEGWSEEEAVEWIDYNTIRALPYAGPKAPIILYDDREEILLKYGD